MSTGIDQKFVHYGIRCKDLLMIESICEAEGIDFDWISEEVLKAYHAKKVDTIEIGDIDTEDIICPIIARLQKGELIIKGQMAFALGMGNKYNKINVTRLI